jgi:hypothetical protein
METNQTIENPKEEQEVNTPVKGSYPNLSQGFGIFGYLILFSLAYGLLLGLPKMFILNGSDSVGSFFDLLGYAATFLTVIFLIYRKINQTEFWASLSFSRIKIGLLLIIIPLSLATSFVIEPFVSWLPMPEFMAEIFRDLIKHNAFSMAMVVIFAPILEEVIFRGIILKGFLKNYSPTKAIIWSAVLFGLVHMNPWQFMSATGIGLVMGWLYWKTDSIIPGIILHFVNNLSASLIYLFMGDMELTSREWINNDNIYFSIYLGAGLILTLSFIYIKKLYPKTNQFQNKPD